jgi:hypothetical protein
LGRVCKEDACGNKDMSPINQQMPGSSIRAKGSIYIKQLLQMNWLPPPFPLPSPCFSFCPASIGYATGFQIDSVSSHNQIRDESLRCCPGRGTERKEGWGSMSAPEEERQRSHGLAFPNSVGRPVTSNKEKAQSTSLHSFEPGKPPPPSKVDILNRKIPSDLKISLAPISGT